MPTSSLPWCATTSARSSWTLPPEDLLDAAHVPSLWAVQKTVLMVLLAVILVVRREGLSQAARRAI